MKFLNEWHRPQTGFLTFVLLSHLAALPFAGGVLYWVAQNAGPRFGTVIVHVTESNVDVTIDQETFHIKAFDMEPLVVELRKGRHRLTMTQGETLLHDESFEVEGGEERILTAWRSIEHEASIHHKNLTPLNLDRIMPTTDTPIVAPPRASDSDAAHDLGNQ